MQPPRPSATPTAKMKKLLNRFVNVAQCWLSAVVTCQMLVQQCNTVETMISPAWFGTRNGSPISLVVLSGQITSARTQSGQCNSAVVAGIRHVQERMTESPVGYCQ